MRYEIQSQQGPHKFPTTSSYKLLDDQLLVFLRPWGSQDYNQKFIDEVTHFLSAAQADIEITSPFDFLENLTPLANKVRISLLLAHDHFYKVENKTSFSVGFEAAVLIRNRNEIAWGTVGRFDIYKSSDTKCTVLSASGSDQDGTILLPIELLGVEKDLDLRAGSIVVKSEEIIVASAYGRALHLAQNSSDKTWSVDSQSSDLTYWLSKVKSE